MEGKIENEYTHLAGYDFTALVNSFLDNPLFAIPHPLYPGVVKLMVSIQFRPSTGELIIYSDINDPAYLDPKVAAAEM